MSQTQSQADSAAPKAIPSLQRAVMFLGVALTLSLVANIIQVIFLAKKSVQTVAMSESGRVVPLIPLDKPYVNDGRVIGYVEECLRTSFSHDFENFRITMRAASDCYTVDGAGSFENAMAPLLKEIRDRSMVMAAALEPTVVRRDYKVNGVVHWETQTPMVIYRKGTKDALKPQRVLVTSTVTRVPLDEHVRGISLRAIALRYVGDSS